MRRLIDVYIRSSELNDPAWDLMDEDKRVDDSTLRPALGSSSVHATGGLLLGTGEEQPKTDKQLYGFTRKGDSYRYKEIYDVMRDVMNRLDCCGILSLIILIITIIIILIIIDCSSRCGRCEQCAVAGP